MSFQFTSSESPEKIEEILKKLGYTLKSASEKGVHVYAREDVVEVYQKSPDEDIELKFEGDLCALYKLQQEKLDK